ncbi:LysR family transcriptional regulator [Rheinheimera mangrovi]|uniref:LysR family transcriptional regulator n=1 Tax=Rheinheimera mangrovi TaxID=2498451 RepID=UPI0013DF4969|nr:LysR family transcriptional regulator [Rheinheimera mangrovi]
MRDLEISLLRCFSLVARLGNMTEASRLLHLSQGAVSLQIKKLEQQLDTLLFNRSKKGLELTRRGEHLFALAQNLLQQHDQLCAEFNGIRLSGTVHIGLPPDLVRAWLPKIYLLLQQEFPQLDVQVKAAGSIVLKQEVDRGVLDLALVEIATDQVLSGALLRVEPLVWIGARFGKARLMEPLPVSFVHEDCVFKAAIRQQLAFHHHDYKVVLENGHLETTLTAVRADMAVTAQLRSTITDEFQIIDELPPLPDFAIHLYSGDRPLRAAALVLADTLVKLLGKSSLYQN